jgi:hypothetical protein
MASLIYFAFSGKGGPFYIHPNFFQGQEINQAPSLVALLTSDQKWSVSILLGSEL